MVISCPRMTSENTDFGVEHPTKYRSCTRLPLRRYWDGPTAMPNEAGLALVGAEELGLSFYVQFQDSDIFSTATGDNQKMWTLGDVAEFFVKPGIERSDYWELHITPNDFIMDIYISDRSKFQAGAITWDQVIAHQSASRKRVEVVDGQWSVEVCIPWSAFGVEGVPANGTIWQFAVCRYNYNDGLDDPAHSSTANLTSPNFHRYEDFSDLVF